MRKTGLKLCALVMLGLLLNDLHAQTTIPASGGDASGTGGTVSYSIGQPAYCSNVGGNGTCLQGIQQPYEILAVDVAEEIGTIKRMLSVYPNPTSGSLILTIYNDDSPGIQSMVYHIIDKEGKLLENKSVFDKETCIDMGNLTPSTYFLKVIEKNKIIKTFKIVKN
jgi:Secretion system C-terminal sorting domain